MGANKIPSIKYMLLADVANSGYSFRNIPSHSAYIQILQHLWSSTHNDDWQFPPFSDVFTNGCFLKVFNIVRISMASLSVFIESHFSYIFHAK
jgi:hypothetical protein